MVPIGRPDHAATAAPADPRGPSARYSRDGLRALGVEEEFHLVDLVTRRASARAPEVLAALPGGPYVAEMSSCMVETNTEVVLDLGDLQAELVARRAVLRRAARPLGVGVVAAGTVPVVGLTPPALTEQTRYRWMRAEYAGLATEHLICSTQIHAEVADRDEAVAVAASLTPYLPILLALSASSPFDRHGADTGYASSRTLVWSRWPTSGPLVGVGTAAEYDALLHELVRSGVALDEGMMYFDIRPARVAPTVELRICDSCPSVDAIVLIAGLYRALVDRAVAYRAAGERPRAQPAALARSATWRAARSGLRGDLVDPISGLPRPAPDVITDLIESLEPQLRRTGDHDRVARLARSALAAGTSADRQRAAWAERGRLTDVVDLLLAETAAPGMAPRAARTRPSDKARHDAPKLAKQQTAGVSNGTLGHVATYRCPVGCGTFQSRTATAEAPTLCRCPRCGGPATRAGGAFAATTCPQAPSGPGRFGWRPRPPEGAARPGAPATASAVSSSVSR